MKKAIISRSRVCLSKPCRSDAGVTMILVAVCMVAIIAMAALSIDVVTLYLARMEAQRSADAGALAAARVISLSGITGDPNNTSLDWAQICGSSGTALASEAAQAAASQTVENAVPTTVTVNYSSQGSTTGATDCSTLGSAFAINPTVIVQVTRSGLPTMFSRMWSRSTNTVSATALAEAFNPSNSGSIASGGNIIPVWPRCVKPWMVPNKDPLSPGFAGGNYCDQGTPPGASNKLVDRFTGQIENPGISLNGNNANGVIGEQFWLSPDCHYGGSSCGIRTSPQANYTVNPHLPYVPDLLYVPGQAPTTTPVAVPRGATDDLYEEAVAGCDESTQYECGVASMNTVDLSENPAGSGDTTNGVAALIRESNPSDTQPNGQDQLSPYAAPSAFPFQILAGSANPYLSSGSAVSGSTSIVTVPIYDYTGPGQITTSTTGTVTVTIVGFLQVFINAVDQYGNVNVTVVNVSGCGNGGGTSPTGTAVLGSSPVPVRLISQ
jgi:Flp pilus assembly protein TadG